ncbi:hypothetical protein L596_010218 [Steinernema carpocapsae]|uniref:G-protein coupled receptors family 1 profile domain-containing protein n=1 Tax=Steinernema carpocapsae TaxID=34508 RepID=A0A4U5PHP1_STECR|nr:hypothetical protein L596_010218 [Steinernema carpocapsae]
MSASNLMASFFPLSLNSFYFGFYLTNSKVNFILCNIVRKLGHHGQIPGIWSVLVVAFDRFCTFCLQKDVSHRYIFVLFTLPYAYIAVIIAVELSLNNILFDFICIATIEGPFWLRNLTGFLWTVSAAIATICSVFVIKSAYNFKSKTGDSWRRSTQCFEKRVSYAVFLQSLLPALLSVPFLTTMILQYNRKNPRTQFLVNKFHLEIYNVLPDWFSWLSNSLMYIYFALNPVITVVFIRQYQQAILKISCFWKSSQVSSVVIPIHASVPKR